jgi:hypothetical protein
MPYSVQSTIVADVPDSWLVKFLHDILCCRAGSNSKQQQCCYYLISCKAEHNLHGLLQKEQQLVICALQVVFAKNMHSMQYISLTRPGILYTVSKRGDSIHV